VVGAREEDQRITQTHYYGQQGLGWTLRKPTSVTIDPYGLKLTTTTVYDPKTGAVVESGTVKGVQEKENVERPTYQSSFGSFGSGNGQLREPEGGLATDASGNVWVSDTLNSRLEEFNSKGEFVRTAGSPGEGVGQFGTTYGVTVDSKGNVWATDTGNDRVEEFSGAGVFVKMFGWGVSNGEAKLQTCTSACRAGLAGSGNGEFSTPEGIAVDSKGNIFVADRGNRRVQEFNESLAWVRNISKTEEKEGPFYLNVDSSGNLWVAYSWDSQNQIAEFNTSEGKVIRMWGIEGSAAGQLKDPYGVAVGAEGDVWVSEYGNSRVQVFTPLGEYLYGFGSKGNGPGQFSEAPHGLAFFGSSIYVLDSGVFYENTGNSRIEKWQLNHEIEGTGTVHDKQTIYYSAATNAQYPTCGGHVEWEGMPCITRPGAQPVGSQAPSLPTTTIESYNMWGEPETTKETFPANEKFAETSRTKKIEYDEAGRPASSEEKSTSAVDKALPKVTTSESIGLVCGQTKTVRCVTQSATEGETTYTITSVYDTFGRLVSYTDADKNTTTYEYEPSGDGRLTSVTDAKGYQDYAYDPTTGTMTKLLDSGAKTFTAGYDVEGNMTNETYPNGMTATYTRDQTGATTGIEYVKTTHCTEKCVWFSGTTAPSIHGETISRANTLTNDAYAYDAAGRLTQTNETPTGKGCTTRVYAYDEESNRTSLTTREPGLEGKCATEGGTSETHSYDEANRLTDTGVVYDPLGNTTKLPASDAGGSELTSSFYVDGQVEKQTQNGQENVYSIDPAGRVRKSVGKGTKNVTAISHYAGTGEALSWKDEEAGKYTRLIPGPDGSLCGTETNGEAPVLQLHDLQGDIVATAALAETETKLQSTYNSTEFGVPTNGAPPTKYSWLGAAAVSSELSSGELLYGTVAYQPQLGRALQTQAVVPPGMAVNGATSETAAYSPQVAAWEIAANNATGQLDTREFERQKAAEREAEEKICPIASMCVQPEQSETEEEVEAGNESTEIKVGSPVGENAHSAEVIHIICIVKTHHPHVSTHYPETVNVIVEFACSEPVLDIRLRLALYFNNNELVQETGYVNKGNGIFAKENVAVFCVNGVYYAWGYADFVSPPGYTPPRGSSSVWSKRVRIKC
jgi:YD repeat-containing protein